MTKYKKTRDDIICELLDSVKAEVSRNLLDELCGGWRREDANKIFKYLEKEGHGAFPDALWFLLEHAIETKRLHVGCEFWVCLEDDKDGKLEKMFRAFAKDYHLKTSKLDDGRFLIIGPMDMGANMSEHNYLSLGAAGMHFRLEWSKK